MFVLVSGVRLVIRITSDDLGMTMTSKHAALSFFLCSHHSGICLIVFMMCFTIERQETLVNSKTLEQFSGVI